MTDLTIPLYLLPYYVALFLDEAKREAYYQGDATAEATTFGPTSITYPDTPEGEELMLDVLDCCGEEWEDDPNPVLDCYCDPMGPNGGYPGLRQEQYLGVKRPGSTCRDCLEEGDYPQGYTYDAATFGTVEG